MSTENLTAQEFAERVRGLPEGVEIAAHIRIDLLFGEHCKVSEHGTYIDLTRDAAIDFVNRLISYPPHRICVEFVPDDFNPGVLWIGRTPDPVTSGG